MPGRLVARENERLTTGPAIRTRLECAVAELNATLRPRRPVATFDDSGVTFRNVVGSARLADGTILEVSPKVDGSDSWPDAVVQLIDSNTRIVVTGSQRSQPSSRRNDLSAALALEYARRLEYALRAEGPPHVYERHHLSSRRLNGRLDLTKWVRSAVLDPARFPISRDELTAANDFSRGLSLVAGWLRRVSDNPEVTARLRRLQTAVVPGYAVPTSVNPAVSRRPMPPQWGKYRPAWDIAAAMLRNRSVIGDPGRAAGLEIAVEPWPMLETALTRALREICAQDSTFARMPKTTHTLLSTSTGEQALSVIPDGVLSRHGEVFATFEAKYTVAGTTPTSDHAQQALTAAAALSSPLAIIVYPGDQPVHSFSVSGFQGTPTTLVTVGLNLFSYTRRGGDAQRASILLNAAFSSRASGAS